MSGGRKGGRAVRLLRFREDHEAEIDFRQIKEEAPQGHEEAQGWIVEEDGTIRWVGDKAKKEEDPPEDSGTGSGE